MTNQNSIKSKHRNKQRSLPTRLPRVRITVGKNKVQMSDTMGIDDLEETFKQLNKNGIKIEMMW